MVEGATLCAIGLHPALTLKCIEPGIINFAAHESLRLMGFIYKTYYYVTPTSLYSTMVINNILSDEFFPRPFMIETKIESDLINVLNRLCNL